MIIIALLASLLVFAGCNNSRDNDNSNCYSIMKEIVTMQTALEKRYKEEQKTADHKTDKQPIATPEKASGKEVLPEQHKKKTEAPEQKQSYWIDNVNLDDWLNNKWLICAVFLLIQWLEILYYSRTGKTSKTVDAAEASMSNMLGIKQKLAYWLWRRWYMSNHPDKKDPDTAEKNEKGTENE